MAPFACQGGWDFSKAGPRASAGQKVVSATLLHRNKDSLALCLARWAAGGHVPTTEFSWSGAIRRCLASQGARPSAAPLTPRS